MIGLNVVDDSKPTLAVGGFRSPGSDFRPPTGPYDLPMTFDVRANDTGSGLRRADILIDGVVVGPGKEFDGDDCQAEDLSAGGPQVDLALGSQCVTYGDVKIPVKTLDFANGQHTLEVRVTDWAGNVGVWAPAEPWSILNNPDLGSDTQTLNIGSSGVDDAAAEPELRSWRRCRRCPEHRPAEPRGCRSRCAPSRCASRRIGRCCWPRSATASKAA